MRAMILAAGLGTRLRPLTEYCAKPALPIRGRPVVSLLLDFLGRSALGRNAVQDVMINLHYLPQTIRNAVESDCPPELRISWSEESEPLGTGGGIRRAADFLIESDVCVVLAGDMLLDIDLQSVVESHRRQSQDVTLVLLEDPRGDDFGTIGTDSAGKVVRIGRHATDQRGAAAEIRKGLFTGVRIFSQSALRDWPEGEVFEDLRDWLIPGMNAGRFQVAGEYLDPQSSTWEPVGTLSEYLRVNLAPPLLPSLGGEPEHWSGDVTFLGDRSDVILGSRSKVGSNARLERMVVWADETVPESFIAHDGVFAAGQFHDCGTTAAAMGQRH